MARQSIVARLAALAALIVLVGVVAAPALGARRHATGTAVTVIAKEFKFILSKNVVPHGVVTFTIVNKGKLPHDFKIAGKKAKLIVPGQKTKLVVTLKHGRYPYLCTVPGHAKLGMKGVLIVK